MPDLLRDAQLHEPSDHDGKVRHAVMLALKDMEFEAGPISLLDAGTIAARAFDAFKAMNLAVVSAAHPETVAAAVALAKRYCRDDKFGLEWSEFLSEELSRIGAVVDGLKSLQPTTNEAFKELLNDAYAGLVSATEKLMHALAICARWGTPEAIKAGLKAIRTLSARNSSYGGIQILGEMRYLPASLGFYALLAGALDREDYALVKRVCDNQVTRDQSEDAAVTALPMATLISSTGGWKFLKGFENRHIPASGPLYIALQPVLETLGVVPNTQQRFFDEMEAVVTLDFGSRRLQKIETTPSLWFWTVFGDYIFRGYGKPNEPFLQQISQRAELTSAGLFGGTRAKSDAVLQQALKLIRDANLHS